MNESRGLPLLSGPPPKLDPGLACRKCNKEFNIFINRSRKCHHCGYSYCHSCTDFQALLPRSGIDKTGYTAANVCAFCIEHLTITAAGKGHLKKIPLSRLRKYIDAYDIKVDRAVEKDDLINEIIAARTSNGCLPKENENFYRNFSVPNKVSGNHRGLFNLHSHVPSQPPPPRPPPRPQPSSFPRPDLEPETPFPQQARRSPPFVPPPADPNTRRPHSYQPPPHRRDSHLHAPPSSSLPTSTTQVPRPFPDLPPRPTSSQETTQPANPRHRTASTSPPPSLDQLLDMPDSAIASLSISALKSILFTNHVNSRLVLEKSDLVNKVRWLVEQERLEREDQRLREEAEEGGEADISKETMDDHEEMKNEQKRNEHDGNGAFGGEKVTEDDVDVMKNSTSVPSSARLPKLERNGLCVVCQDEDANIAIVDCGHLAMCRDCSELIMKSSRECPLCRTRIVTDQRLLRIFKTVKSSFADRA